MLSPGQILQNRYTIQAGLGQGGMGAVYQVYDSRTRVRCVVKALALQTSTAQESADARRQFEQEAVTLANLRHPGLPRVSDYFSEQGSYFLVMDLIEGQSLDAAIGTTGLPELQVTGYAIQLLDAIAYCHSRNVLHRDIKPQNIIIQPDGNAVLVDFGLVKMMSATGQTSLLTHSFLRGLGTPHYAPPEQYSGGTDARSDLYALAATLYHALTGRVPPSATDRSAGLKVIEPHQFNSSASPQIEQAILKAMALDMGQRFQSAADFKAALMQPVPALITGGAAPLNATSKPRRTAVFASIAVVSLLGAGIAFAAIQLMSNQVSIAPKAASTHPVVATHTVTSTALAVVAMDTPIASTLVPATVPATAAPVAPVSTDAPTMAIAPEIVITPAMTLVPATLEPPATVVEPTPVPAPTDTPLLPTPTASTSQGLIAYHAGAENARQIYIADPVTGKVWLLPNQPANCRVPNWSPDGRQLAFRCSVNNTEQIFTINLDGTGLRQITNASQGENYEPAWSPEGSQMVFASERDGNKEIYLMNADGMNQRRLVSNALYDDDPQWSPDGQWVVFESTRMVDGKKHEDVYKVRPNGEDLTPLTSGGLGNTTPAWSPDGRWIAYETHVSSKVFRIWIMDPNGGSQRQITFDGTDNERATWSPDSREIAYTSDQNGTYGIWIVPIDGSRPPRKISLSEGEDAFWSPFISAEDMPK